MKEDKQVEETERKKVSSIVKEILDLERFQKLHWEGSFDEYLDIVYKNPKAARNAFQRLYDMIVLTDSKNIPLLSKGRFIINSLMTHFQTGRTQSSVLTCTL
jgi:Putative Ser protein kinase